MCPLARWDVQNRTSLRQLRNGLVRVPPQGHARKVLHPSHEREDSRRSIITLTSRRTHLNRHFHIFMVDRFPQMG